MKKLLKGLFAALILLCSSTAFAKDFDWSKCWCNYGAGIKPGTWVANVDVGMSDTTAHLISQANTGYGAFVLPYFDATVDVALPIWKLPLSWGGFFGINIGGRTAYSSINFGAFYMNFGGQVKYHVMLPPEKLDVYAGVRVGASIGASSLTIKIPYLGSININDGSKSGFYIGGFIGGTYYVADWFGFNVEFGAPVWVKAGVSIKIN